MTRLRHRLPPLFFIGLFPVVILLWAWADSMSYLSSWSFSRENEYSHALVLRASSLSFERMELNPALMPAVLKNAHIAESGPFGYFTRRSWKWLGAKLFPALEREQLLAPRSSGAFIETNLRIPLWLILLAYLPFWLGLSIWQARRRRAKITAALPCPACLAFPEN